MTQSPLFIETEPTQISLEISPEEQAQSWQQNYSGASRHWNAYLNQICLNTVLAWLRQDYPQAKPWTQALQHPSFWEVVDGSAITLTGHTANPRHTIRLVLIPSAAIDTSELRVPQEWVDLPSWAGDYYLAAQVEPDEGWLRIWGFTTHARLKAKGTYDTGDRTYALDAHDLTQDLNVLWDAQQLCPEEPIRAALQPLPELSAPQAESLIARLGNPQVLLPRLEVPFTLWGALLEHPAWRQRLYQHRLQMPEQWSVLQWLAGGVSTIAKQIGWQQVALQPYAAGARSIEISQNPGSILVRPLVIAEQRYELRIIPQDAPQSGIWRFELCKLPTAAIPTATIPKGMKLRLLTESLQPFENNEAMATTSVERLYVVVALEPGEGIVWEVDPTPENYEREVLRF
ncbi:MAG: DUF1822 family protein [Drouetiella hepatica Uher 2000/2452]|jgi:hypothetical protein|uniref:DUF1822 family protein n=1 Tax=Drouetiella hepatica Uher 2000/2452 TaxID=904376 RepID=A0A951Q9S5_9CYAN|nr:DUF1822 family protein [Drouetiella hepatica Uher 2000/2452]